MLEPDENGVMMELAPTPMRRGAALLALYALGGMLLWLALTQSPAIGFQLMLLVMGVLALWGAEALRRATATHLELTVEGLREAEGRMLARWDEIEKVERGSFAVKPSNGFLIVLKAPAPRAWAPGLWWRLGRRVGVGGVLAQRPARFMAEQMALKLAGVSGDQQSAVE